MSAAAAQNATDLAMSHEPTAAPTMFESKEKEALAFGRHSSTSDSLTAPIAEFEADLEGEEPTEEELRTLKRVSGKIPWSAYSIAFVELCERFGYYGCQVLCKLHLPVTRIRKLTCVRHQLRPAPASCRPAHW
jgi:POT family proton-dependent oligopeptide transporter